MKIPGRFKTKSAKEAQTQYKTTFGNLAKANYYGKKHNIATKAGVALKDRMDALKDLSKYKKEKWNLENKTRKKSNSKVLGMPIGRVGNAVNWIGRKLSRGVQRTYNSTRRKFTRGAQKITKRIETGAKQKVNNIVKKLHSTEKEPNIGTANVKTKVATIRTAFDARKKKFVENQTRAYDERQTAAKKLKLTSDEQSRLTEGEQAIQTLIKEKRDIDINPNLTSAEKKNVINQIDTSIKTARNSIQYLINKQQIAQKELYKPQLTYEQLNQARQKSVFSSKSKKLRRGELTNYNKSNQAKSALVKKYSSPEGRKKTQEIAGELASKIENYTPEQKQALDAIVTNYTKKSLVDIYSEINQLKGVSDEDKKLISRHMKRKRVNNILSKTYTPKANFVSSISSSVAPSKKQSSLYLSALNKILPQTYTPTSSNVIQKRAKKLEGLREKLAQRAQTEEQIIQTATTNGSLSTAKAAQSSQQNTQIGKNTGYITVDPALNTIEQTAEAKATVPRRNESHYSDVLSYSKKN